MMAIKFYPRFNEKHYSPKARVRINVKKPNADEYFITFGEKNNNNHVNTINLSSTGDLHKFAHRLYACLRDLDSMNIKKIAISPIPHQGIGRAINDELSEPQSDVREKISKENIQSKKLRD